MEWLKPFFCILYILLLKWTLNVFLSIFRDHFFDDASRRRAKQRKAKPSDVWGLKGVMTGERGVREHHRVVKSKILPTDLVDSKCCT